MEVQFTQQECKWCAIVVREFERGFFGSVIVRSVEEGVFAIGKEDLAGGRGVLPAHAAGFSQIEDAGFGLRGAFGCEETL